MDDEDGRWRWIAKERIHKIKKKICREEKIALINRNNTKREMH